VHLSKLTGANKEYILQKIPFIARFITADLSSVMEHSELIVVVNKEPGIADSLGKLEGSKIIFDLADLGRDPRPKQANYHGIAW